VGCDGLFARVAEGGEWDGMLGGTDMIL